MCLHILRVPAVREHRDLHRSWRRLRTETRHLPLQVRTLLLLSWNTATTMGFLFHRSQNSERRGKRQQLSCEAAKASFFCIYIKDLPSNINSKIVCNADNTTAIASSYYMDHLQTEMNQTLSISTCGLKITVSI